MTVNDEAKCTPFRAVLLTERPEELATLIASRVCNGDSNGVSRDGIAAPQRCFVRDDGNLKGGYLWDGLLDEATGSLPSKAWKP